MLWAPMLPIFLYQLRVLPLLHTSRYGQKYIEAGHAVIVFSLDPAWALFWSWLILGEGTNGAGLLGCLLVMVAVYFYAL